MAKKPPKSDIYIKNLKNIWSRYFGLKEVTQKRGNVQRYIRDKASLNFEESQRIVFYVITYCKENSDNLAISIHHKLYELPLIPTEIYIYFRIYYLPLNSYEICRSGMQASLINMF